MNTTPATVANAYPVARYLVSRYTLDGSLSGEPETLAYVRDGLSLRETLAVAVRKVYGIDTTAGTFFEVLTNGAGRADGAQEAFQTPGFSCPPVYTVEPIETARLR